MSMLRCEDEVVEERWLDVLKSITTKKPYAVAPWQPLPGEPRLAQLAFASYRESAQRNLALTASTMAMRYSDIQDFAKLYSWVERAEMYDTWRERAADEARAAAVAQTAVETAAAFARLPALSAAAFQLVEGAVNAKLETQAKLVRRGERMDADQYDEDDDESLKPISITQALNIAGMVRGLLAETSKFLGLKVVVDHQHSGVIGHVHAATDQDAIKFLEGLSEAGYDLGPPAIETSAVEA